MGAILGELSNGENDEEFIYELCSKFLDIIKQYDIILKFFNMLIAYIYDLKKKKLYRSSSYTRVKEKNMNFNDDGEIKQLSAPVQISNWLDNDPENNTKKQKESIFDLKKDDITFVDSKKLEKVEAKLLKKNEKREGKTTDNSAGYDASKSASASQAISRKAENFNDTGNRTFDVVIENFDVSFGNK